MSLKHWLCCSVLTMPHRRPAWPLSSTWLTRALPPVRRQRSIHRRPLPVQVVAEVVVEEAAEELLQTAVVVVVPEEQEVARQLVLARLPERVADLEVEVAARTAA